MRNYRVDCSLLPQSADEYHPRWTARAGAEELYQAYSEPKLSLEEFKESATTE